MQTKSVIIEPEESELQKWMESLIPEARLRWQAIPGTSLSGLLVEEATASSPLSARSTDLVMESPPFWSLLWPSGHFLCRVMGEAEDLVKGRFCIDLGSGSGLVAAAAAIQGAQVVAVDSEPLSRAATSLNCWHNGAECRVAESWNDARCETLLLADFLYDDSNLDQLASFVSRSDEIVVVDSRLKHLELEGFEFLGQFEGTAVPDLDPHREFATLMVWYWGRRSSIWRRGIVF